MLIATVVTIIIVIEAFLMLIFYIIFEKIEKNTIQCFDEIDKMKFCFLFKYEVKKEKSILGAKIIKVKVAEEMFLRCRIDEKFSRERQYRISLISKYGETSFF